MVAQQDPTVIAEIGDTKITAMEVRQIIAREMRSNQIPKGLESVYLRPAISQMINQRAVAYYAAEQGLRVSDEELAKSIQSLLPMLYENGKFLGKDAYAGVLERLNLTIPQFESDLRKQMLATRLESMVLEGIVVSPAEVEAAFRNANEKIKVSYFSRHQRHVPRQSYYFAGGSAGTVCEGPEHIFHCRRSEPCFCSPSMKNESQPAWPSTTLISRPPTERTWIGSELPSASALAISS